MKILLTGGGTGGHLIPLLSVVSEIKKRDADAEFLFVGPKSDFNESLREAGIEVKEVKAGKLRRYFSLQNFSDIFKVLVGIDEAFFHILKFKPDVVFSKGGFASVPAVVAASYLRIPILTHESDTVPGLSNKIIGRLAKKVFISFPQSRNYFLDSKIIVSGNPIREDILEGDKPYARRFFGLLENLPVVLVFGGSQGAQKINELLLGSLDEILFEFQVIHICGNRNFKEIKERTDALDLKYRDRYRAYPYLGEEMKDAFALADFVVSRAGASSLSEIIALEKPSLIIPLPSAANNHQYHNAKYFADQGMIMLAEEKDLSSGKFLEKMEELKGKENETKDSLQKHNASLGNKKPSEIIAEEILKFK
ncbi:MAG: undecaprenyldiphospho-muramoylpentapeptide beta-N-acetylglucosaminyltransferase [Candidatus Pacebacteria bacterium]|nr:undecaprenyldiphospho-muramoylpentapeptide beta-N-acetylglucosaminyltransferase [Candidatus Paceibacterota bacterium]